MSFNLTEAQKARLYKQQPNQPAQPLSPVQNNPSRQTPAPVKSQQAPMQQAPQQQMNSQAMMNQLMQQMANQPQQSVQQMYREMQSMVPQVKRAETLDYDTAKARAYEQVQPIYQESMDKQMKSIQQDALRRGMYQQLPTAGLQARAAREGANQKSQAVSSLANQLVGQSQAEADRRYQQDNANRQFEIGLVGQLQQMAMQQRQNQFGNIMAMMQFQAGREDAHSEAEWRKMQSGFQEAGITGMYQGKPTMAYQQFMEEMGFRKDEAAHARKIAEENLKIAWHNATKVSGGSGGSGSYSGSEDDFQRQVLQEAWDHGQKMAGDWERYLTVDLTAVNPEGKPIYNDSQTRAYVADAQRQRNNVAHQHEQEYLRRFAMTGAASPEDDINSSYAGSTKANALQQLMTGSGNPALGSMWNIINRPQSLPQPQAQPQQVTNSPRGRQ